MTMSYNPLPSGMGSVKPGIFTELTAGSRAAYPSGILFFHAERRSDGLLHKKGEKG